MPTDQSSGFREGEVLSLRAQEVESGISRYGV